MDYEIYQKILIEMNKSLINQIPYYIEEKKHTKIDVNNVLGANINIVGEEECELFIFGEKQLFFEIAKEKYGFEVPDEVLPSYVGELWNFVLGPIIKEIKKMGKNIDISHSVPITDGEEKVCYDTVFSYRVKKENEMVGNINVYALKKEKGGE